MGKMNQLDIVVGELLAANPVVDYLAYVIEEEHLQFHYDLLADQGISEYELQVIDSHHYKSFWENLFDNFDEYFLDNGIAVNTYEAFNVYELTKPEEEMVYARFRTIMIEKAKLAIQQRIDCNVLEL